MAFLVPIVAAVAGAAISSDASRKASNTQADAAQRASDTQLQMYEQNRADQAPYRDIGYNALAKLTDLLNNGGITSRFAGMGTNEPGYQFGLGEGQRALEHSAAARGLGLSGAALKAGTRYAQDYAGTKYNEAFNRWNTENNGIYNRLAGIAGIGQVATNQVGQQGLLTGQEVGQNTINSAAQNASGIVNRGNIYANALNQVGGYWMNRYPGSNNMSIWDPNYESTQGWTGQH